MLWSYNVQVDCVWNVMAHAQKPDLVFRRNGRVHLNRRGRQFSRRLAAEVCASAVVMLDTPSSVVVWQYWLPTPFASFPFTSPPVRHRVPSGFNWTLQQSYLRFDPCLWVTPSCDWTTVGLPWLRLVFRSHARYHDYRAEYSVNITLMHHMELSTIYSTLPCDWVTTGCHGIIARFPCWRYVIESHPSCHGYRLSLVTICNLGSTGLPGELGREYYVSPSYV